jgi:Ca-activated chloride channel family protein
MVYFLLEIGGGENAQSLPMNIGLVIDVSESMHIRMVTEEQFKELVGRRNIKEILKDGIPAWEIESVSPEMVGGFPRKIDYVSEALTVVSEYLRPKDRYSLTAFAARSENLIPMLSGNERGRLIKNAHDLEFIHLGDETRMAEGLEMAYKEIRETQGDRIASRIILLTDGYTKDAKECYYWAKQAQEVGLAITTMGVGVEFNEDLLIPIAEMTGGNAYFIEKPERIPDAFRKELGSALGVRYHNLKLHMNSSVGVEIRNVYRVLPEMGNIERETEPGGLLACHLGNFDPNFPPAFLFEIVVPALDTGTYKILKLDLSWDDGEGDIGSNFISEDITATIGGSLSVGFDERVMAIVDKVGAFKLGSYALDNVDDGDQIGSVKRFQMAASRLAEVNENKLAEEMSRMADKLQKQGKLDSIATKRLRYDTRRITSGKMTKTE